MKNKNFSAEILYIDDCPSWNNAGAVLEEAMKDLGLSQEIVYTFVENEEEAVEKKFTGSPMITINGENLFPTNHTNYALGCRVYQTPDGFRGWPTKKMFLENLRRELVLE
jgi:hypothetical protein